MNNIFALLRGPDPHGRNRNFKLSVVMPSASSSALQTISRTLLSWPAHTGPSPSPAAENVSPLPQHHHSSFSTAPSWYPLDQDLTPSFFNGIVGVFIRTVVSITVIAALRLLAFDLQHDDAAVEHDIAGPPPSPMSTTHSIVAQNVTTTHPPVSWSTQDPALPAALPWWPVRHHRAPKLAICRAEDATTSFSNTSTMGRDSLEVAFPLEPFPLTFFSLPSRDPVYFAHCFGTILVLTPFRSVFDTLSIHSPTPEHTFAARRAY